MAESSASAITTFSHNPEILFLDSNYIISSTEEINVDTTRTLLTRASTPTTLNVQTETPLSNITNPLLQYENEITSLESLLRKWNLYEELYEFLSTFYITLEGLRYMKERHVDELFTGENLNNKIIFEHKLTVWQNECGIYNFNSRCDSDTLPPSSSVESWINRMNSPSTSSRSSDDVCVVDIINRTEQGKALCKRYHEKGYLCPEDRTDLVHKIVQYFIENDISLAVSKCKALAEQIIKIFPTEQKATYFIGRGRNPPKGKLWDRYQGRKRALRRLRTFAKPVKTKSLDTIVSQESEKEDISGGLSFMELEEISKSLKHLRKWDEVIINWKKTVEYRRNQLNSDLPFQQILQNWPLYKYAQAPELVEIDYQYIYPNKNFSYVRWERFCQIAITVFEERIKDTAAKAMLKEIIKNKDDLNTDNKNIVFSQLLHAILVPFSRYTNGKRIKYTIRDSQRAFTLLVTQSSEINSIMAEKRGECLKSKTTLQPLIIATGKNYEYNHFYVDIDGEKFQFKSYLEALQYCFKLIFVLNLKYPGECVAVWVFIQKFFFSIEDTLEEFPIVETFISDLQQKISKSLL